MWEMSKLLLNSELYDSIITSQISCNYIFIGTYGEVFIILFITYIKKLLSAITCLQNYRYF